MQGSHRATGVTSPNSSDGTTLGLKKSVTPPQLPSSRVRVLTTAGVIAGVGLALLSGNVRAQISPQSDPDFYQSPLSPPPPSNPSASMAAMSTFAPSLSLPTGVAVGRTAGAFAVSQNGSATYSMALWTPPGIAKVQPQLSLSYSSSGGNGLTGMGWAVTGFSSVNRCDRTVAQDGIAGALDLTTSDRFCLDGKRLRSFAGTTYGADGGQYQTEIADFSLIISHGSSGVGPAWFEVYAKNGLIYEFGNVNAGQATAHAALLSATSSTVLTWALNKIRDRLGNYVAFDYTNDTTNHVLRPVTITYTTSPGTTATPQYQVLFSYETRTSPISSYLAGTLQQESNRINQVAIQSWNGSAYAPARTYNLSYSTGPTGLDRITSISECSPTQCFPATTVGYQEGTGGWGSQQTVSGIPAGVGVGRGDFNGDGIDDLFYQSGTTVYYMLGQTSGTFLGPYSTGIVSPGSSVMAMRFFGKNRADLAYKNASGNWRGCSFATAGSTFSCTDTTSSYASGLVADIDGDGYDDIAYLNSANNVVYRRNLQGTGFGAETVLYTPDVGEALSTLVSTNSGPSSVRLRDFNGDGRDDLMVFTKYCRQLHLGGSCPPGPYSYYWLTLVSKADGTYVTGAKIAQPAIGSVWPPILGDYNGDGCADVVTANPTSGTLQVSYGACDGISLAAFSTTATTSLSTSTYTSGNWAYAADVDGDRRGDLLLYNTSTSTWGYALSTGSNFGAWTAISPSLTSFSWVGDLNGDGLPDILGVGASSVTYRLHSGIEGDLATSFVDGFGVTYSPTYEAISHSTSYTKGTGAGYPEVDYAGPVWVVTSYSATDGIGGTYSVSETYTGARLEVKGRGFEGFATTQSRDSRSNYYVKSQYAQTFPLTGMLAEQTVYQSNGTTVVSDVTNTIPAGGAVLDSTANNQRYFPYVSQSVTSAYEVNGALNGSLITQSTTTPSYAGSNGFTYGNPSQVVTTIVDKDSTSPWVNNSFTDTVVITPHEVGTPVPAGWCIGLNDQTAETRSGTGVTPLTHTMAYDISTEGLCRVRSQTVEPTSTIDKVVSTYGYTDGCGNVNSVAVTGQTVAGAAMATRTTTANFGTRCLQPETVTNALSQATLLSYRYDLGLRTSVTDPNGLATTTTYSDLGQPTLIQRPDGTQTAYSYAACTGTSCLSDSTLKYTVQQSEQDATTGHATFWYTQQYSDAFSRPRFSMPLQSNGAQITTAVGYDSRGRTITRTNPYGNGFSSYTTTTVFDDLNRPTSEYRPISSTNSTLEYTYFTYQGRTRTTQDPRTNVITNQADAIGELRRVTDPDGVSKTQYTYNSFGALTSIVDPATNLMTRTFDALGYLQTGATDSDRGSWVYQYDSLGELVNVRDAKTTAPSWTKQLTYDALGRTTQRVESEGTTTWTWGVLADNDATHKYIGRLKQLSGLGDTESSTFDAVGRMASHSMVWSGTTYTANYAYNTLGRLDTLTYPTVPGQANRFQVKYGYTDGFLSAAQNYTGGTAGTTFWQLTPGVTSMDPWGHVVDETFGTTTAVRVRSAFDAVTSWVATRQVGTGGVTNNLQSLAYQWDLVGNLAQRQDLKQSLTEIFTNDNLNRLQLSTLNGTTNFSSVIDATGNITSRTEGDITYPYSYDPTHKHAVVTVGSGANQTSYGYDANGNMSTRNGLSLSWSSANLPTTINGPGGVSASFSYGPDRQRKQQTSVYTTDGDSGTETTTYFSGLFEVEVTPAQTHYKHFVQVPGGSQIIYDIQSVSGVQTTYVTADHLGSGNLLINSAGTVLANESFSAYGYRRSSNWASTLSASSSDYTTIASTTRRGYTDAFHELLDNVGLIHMNGRVFDPVIGRFLSVDPVIAHMGNSQSGNPYSYVRNQPLTLTDPSGFVANDPKAGLACIDNCNGPRGYLPDKVMQTLFAGMNASVGPGWTAAHPTDGGESLIGGSAGTDMLEGISETMRAEQVSRANAAPVGNAAPGGSASVSLPGEVVITASRTTDFTSVIWYRFNSSYLGQANVVGGVGLPGFGSSAGAFGAVGNEAAANSGSGADRAVYGLFGWATKAQSVAWAARWEGNKQGAIELYGFSVIGGLSSGLAAAYGAGAAASVGDALTSTAGKEISAVALRTLGHLNGGAQVEIEMPVVVTEAAEIQEALEPIEEAISAAGREALQATLAAARAVAELVR